MTYESERAKKNAISFDAWKWKITEQTGGIYRIPFDVKSEELPEAVKNAPVGTRFLVVLVELNDDETAKEHPRDATNLCSPPSDQGKGSDSLGHDEEYLSLNRMAHVLLEKVEFQDFISAGHDTPEENLEYLLRINSMTELKEPEVQERFRALLKEYNEDSR